MFFWKYLQRQICEIRNGGSRVAARKVRTGVRWLLDFLIGLPVVAVVRLLRPVILIRFNPIYCDRMGHLVEFTELYLCARDAGINVPARRYIDISFFTSRVIPNAQIGIMWQRILRVGPSWLLRRAYRVSQFLPVGACHDAGNYAAHLGPDVHALLDTAPSHLRFTEDEESRGKAGLRAMGIPEGLEFICVHARDSVYLPTLSPREDHTCNDYRDANIQNYVLAAETLAERGYFVVRMGAVVAGPINSNHPNVIDYATSGLRTDFMDIYLASKCFFYLGSNSGIDLVAIAFRRPVAIVNHAPVGCLSIGLRDTVFIAKQYLLLSEARFLTLKEVFFSHVDFLFFSHEYEKQGIKLIENTSEEIKDLAIEMLDRLEGAWQSQPVDDELQYRFLSICRVKGRDGAERPFQELSPPRYGAQFLRNNPQWLD